MGNKKAFTLMEVLITAAIVGILAMMAIPNLVKTVNSSYKQDALHNLLAIYSAEQNWAQNHNGEYLYCPDLACINDSNAGLGLSITSSGGINYTCDTPSGSGYYYINICIASAPESSGKFSAMILLDTANPVAVSGSPANCDPGSNFLPDSTHNPCIYNG